MAFPEKLVIGFLNFSKICEVPDAEGAMPRSIEGGLVELMSHVLGFEYTFVMPVDKTWGSPTPGGNSTGLIGMVERGEADIGMCFMAISESRQEVVDFSDWYFTEDVTFATHLPKLLPRTLIYTLPFQLKTWISIFLTVIVMSLLLFVMSSFKISPLKLLFELYANVLNQSLRSSHWKHRILRGCWWTFVLVVSFSYKAVIQSFSAFPQRSSPLRDFEELSDAVLRGEYNSIGPISGIKYFFLNSNKAHLVALAKAMEKSGGFLPLSEYNNNANIKDKTAIISSRIMLNFRFGEPPLSTMYIAQNRGIRFRIGMAVGKKFCCLEALNGALQKIIQAGLYYKLLNDEEFKAWLSATKIYKHQDRKQSLTLSDISGALVVLVAGILLATAVLIFEILFKKPKTDLLFPSKVFSKQADKYHAMVITVKRVNSTHPNKNLS